MKISLLTTIIALIVVLSIGNAIQLPESAKSINVAACASGNWVPCGLSLGGFVFGLHSWQDGAKIPILGRECTVSTKGRIRKFKWVWDGRLRCPFGHEGSSGGHKSRNGAAEWAVKDFFGKNANLLNSMQQ